MPVTTSDTEIKEEQPQWRSNDGARVRRKQNRSRVRHPFGRRPGRRKWTVQEASGEPIAHGCTTSGLDREELKVLSVVQLAEYARIRHERQKGKAF